MNEVLTYSEKETHIQTLEREFDTTLRVLKAYPENKLDLKPSEISKTAKELISTFVVEQLFTEQVLAPVQDYSKAVPETKNNLSDLINAYESKFKQNLNKMKELPEAEFNNMTKWWKSGKLIDMRRMDVLNVFLYDMIHHRGQLSVYMRMAGGILPHIYGPTYEDSLKK